MSEHSSCPQPLTPLGSKEEVPSESESCSVQTPPVHLVFLHVQTTGLPIPIGISAFAVYHFV